MQGFFSFSTSVQSDLLINHSSHEKHNTVPFYSKIIFVTILLETCNACHGNNDYISLYSIPHDIESVTGSKSMKSSPRELTVVELISLQVTGTERQKNLHHLFFRFFLDRNR